MELCLRCFVEVDTEASALQIKEEIKDIINIWGPITLETVEPYWKINEYFEIFLCCPVNEIASYQKLLSSLGSGWEEPSEKEAMWNPTQDAQFFHDSVRWAHFEIIE